MSLDLRMGEAALLAVLVGLNTGCSNEAYCYTCGDHDSSAESGVAGSSGTGGSGGSDGGVFYPETGQPESSLEGGDELSDGAPCQADTQNDPLNCGACGFVCDLFGAFPKCEQGICKIDSCAPNFYDINGIDSDGCEYPCTMTNGGVEICDTKDNDCNGLIDEGFDLSKDPKNCGGCGIVCDLPNATARCDDSGAFPTCAIDQCDPGYADIDGLASSGCEYACPVFPIQPEQCNAVDDNCDGRINEGNPGGGEPCEETCPNGECKGQCTPGTTTCVGTKLVCVPGVGPSLEVCDGIDNDCDGEVDEGFDLMNDPAHCGQCNHACVMDNAIGGCVQGKCVISACLPGFASINGNDSDGCEYKCPVYPTAPEVCNGMDDDCNGVVDDPIVVAAQKPDGKFCNPQPLLPNPCKGTDFVCTGKTGWRCNYGPEVEVDGQGKVVLVETRCDGKDGNCNGQVDESWPDLGSECDNGEHGACRDVGIRICDPNDNTKTTCDLSPLPDPDPSAPRAETCNGVDDDCNGQVDDGIVDDMVEVKVGALHFFIDRFEASRPDATATDPGWMETRRCVNSGVYPWTYANYAEAEAACAKTGHRLCTAQEYRVACESAAGHLYPYGNVYEPMTCNGLDYDGVPGGANDNVLIPTGNLLQCVAPGSIFDLSGNAAEWTSSVTSNTGPPTNLDIHVVMGGSYQTPALGLSCGFDLSRFAENAILPELGFRCCKDP
ncbi:MAG TPA: MopE-related protein [Polyangiaceae bacterium]|jgi:hypothetical protein|nr:MAG: Protein metal binding site [Deltaproteobacteria bacterium ADurb.Bin207]HNS99359.1 MopE-related protein [Polyangiaceae bacterium]HNZ24398.1 MopE-related protein [Polyangiaceae bacterium]HOD22580.1 MopE-related protein [Polyangiaceae bacterium]HOE51900.1 MopE-related protein [Polyangiaceae bacterium]